jgi:hypothetical protein
VPLGVQREQAGQNFVAEGGGPEEAALLSVVVLIGLIEEDRLGLAREVVPVVRQALSINAEV